MHKLIKLIAIGLGAPLFFALCGYAAGESKSETSLRQERSKLERTSDAVDRTKIQIKISDLLITLLTDAARAENDMLVDQHLNDYSSTIQDAHETMMKTGKDAHKHPAGFKDLEIALRKQQRRLADAARMLRFDQRGPMDKVRKMVSDIDDQLVKVMLLKDSNATRKP